MIMTYDVHFNDETDSNNKGFKYSFEEAKGYIDSFNGTNESYFEDYPNGVASVVCNETGEVVYEALIKSIFEEISQLEGGFTFSLEEGKTVTEGYVVGYAETQDSHGPEGLKKCIEHAEAHDGHVGGWQYGGKYYYDSVKVFDTEAEAKIFAQDNRQIAYFDINKGEEIFIVEEA